MSFAHPEALALLPLAALVAGWQWRPGPALAFPNVAALVSLPRGQARFARVGIVVLKTLAAVLLAIAAAGPRTPDLATRLPSNGVAIAIALDVSGSMGTPDFSGASRLQAAQRAFAAFVAKRPHDCIGLITFAAVPRTECPPTLNHSVVLEILNSTAPRSGVDAGTNIGDALAEALARVRGAAARRQVIILLTDGEHNATGDSVAKPLTPRQAAQLAANVRVPVYAIDCGGPPDAAQGDAKAQREDGRRTLEQVAELTQGRFFAADDAAQLRTTLDAINALETSRIDSFLYRRYHEHSQRLGLAAALLLAITLALEATVWRRWPT
jgi:Ca-activated chloride channel family protein